MRLRESQCFPLNVYHNEKQHIMKKNILMFGLAFLMLSCIAQNPKNMNTERLTYFHFDHHNTMVMFGGENYEVSLEKDGRIHVVIDESYPREKDFYLDDSTILDELKAIVDQYKMDKYKSDYQPEMQVFDGDSWSLYYKYDSGRRVRSGGYMAWPDNYREAHSAIHEYFQKWRDYAITAKAINEFHYTCKNNNGCDIEYHLIRGEEEATLTLRNAEYDTDKQLMVSNDYLSELQELVNMYRLKDESSHSSSEEDATNYRFTVRYNNGDSIDFTGYHTTFVGGMENAFQNYFEQWLPLRGNLIKFDCSIRTIHHDISYYISRNDDRFSLLHFDEQGQKHEAELDAEFMQRLQQVLESLDIDKSKDRKVSMGNWSIEAFFDSRDMMNVGGGHDEASEQKAQQIKEALEELFAPYL